jgi:hypothetical protein
MEVPVCIACSPQKFDLKLTNGKQILQILFSISILGLGSLALLFCSSSASLTPVTD